ncbi:uncharacterized protein LOC116355062 [Oncorhynchus kisutch]|uniref:uncharacterized protein LOC116355062 n=1 Tax=Oncorhynchus kisutch TaxID=8019 RepID=UPI0012DED2D9|nr:uncharacterized protein LOC116355062 [Oncorhynchus kisutch]
MIDIEHEAVCKLRRSLYPTWPAVIDPKVHSIVERAVRSIMGELSNEPHSNLLSPSQVVVEVVPRLLLALWLQPEEGHSGHPILISGMAVGMVAAVVEKLSSMLKAPSPQIPFSRAAAFESVLSILGRISQSFSTDDLQSPFYMRSVCALVADEVQSCFQPPAATFPVLPVVAAAISTAPPDILAEADPASPHIEVVNINANTEADQASSHLEVVDFTANTDADSASSHLEIVDITANIEADPASSHLEVVDITHNIQLDTASSHLEVVNITRKTEADPACSHLEVVDIGHKTEADRACSHLEVVEITPKTEADPANSHLEVQDITSKTQQDPASSHLEVVNITRNKEADLASFHLNVVDITPNREAEPISSLLEVVDVTPEERTLKMAVFATLPTDIQAEDVAVVISDVTPHVTKDVTLDVPCRAACKGKVRRFFFRLWRAVCCCACHKEEKEQY